MNIASKRATERTIWMYAASIIRTISTEPSECRRRWQERRYNLWCAKMNEMKMIAKQHLVRGLPICCEQRGFVEMLVPPIHTDSRQIKSNRLFIYTRRLCVSCVCKPNIFLGECAEFFHLTQLGDIQWLRKTIKLYQLTDAVLGQMRQCGEIRQTTCNCTSDSTHNRTSTLEETFSVRFLKIIWHFFIVDFLAVSCHVSLAGMIQLMLVLLL